MTAAERFVQRRAALAAARLERARRRQVRAAEEAARYRARRDAPAPISPTQPRTRGDCVDGPRPCPWSECRYHLGVRTAESCALDVAGGGGVTLAEIAAFFDLTRERIRQIEEIALRRFGVAWRRIWGTEPPWVR